jgi:hypothetical protein
MSLFGFFQIRCGWLPVAQMFQDLLQAGDVMPNLLGMVSGHTYYYFTEVAPMLLLPRRVGWLEAADPDADAASASDDGSDDGGDDGDGDGDGDGEAGGDGDGDGDGEEDGVDDQITGEGL